MPLLSAVVLVLGERNTVVTGDNDAEQELPGHSGQGTLLPTPHTPGITYWHTLPSYHARKSYSVF